MVTIQTLIIPPFQENCYIVSDSETKEAVIIDPGYDSHRIIDLIEKENYQVLAYLITHTHFDHLSALEDLQAKFPAKTYINPDDAPLLEFLPQIQQERDFKVTSIPSDYEKISDQMTITHGNLSFLAITTPGHSPGSTCFLIQDTLFTGDTLFAKYIGRTDFAFGDHPSILKSIKEKLYILPENTTSYPGHGPTSTIGEEKQNNLYCRIS